VLLRPLDVADGFVDVVEEDLRNAGASLGSERHEVGEPAVVGADAGQPARELLGRRRARDHRAGREERRHGVRKDHLRRSAVGLLLLPPHRVVPVAEASVTVEVLERVLVAVAPRVELVAVVGVEVLAVLLVAPAAV